MEKPKICFVIVLLTVAAIGVFYFSIQRGTPELCDTGGFHWFQHWDDLDLGVVKKFYQRYTVAEMQLLWNEKLFSKYGNAVSIASAETLSPWHIYLASLLDFGHPFLDFSDYESALETRLCLLIPTRRYWRTLNSTERAAYLSVRGFPSDTTWEAYQDYLVKQSVVYRINWWRSGGIDPFLE